jgi:hypothetical protein
VLGEGFDVSQLNKDLLLEMKRTVSVGKSSEVESAIKKGIRMKSFRLLDRLIQYVEQMQVVLDVELLNVARRCLSSLRSNDLMNEIYCSMWTPQSREKIQVVRRNVILIFNY